MVNPFQNTGEKKVTGELAVRQHLENRYRILFEGAPIMYVTTRDQNGIPIIVEANQLFLTTLGYSAEEVIGRQLADFYSPKSREALLAGGYQEALEDRFGVAERHLITRQGVEISTLLRVISDVDENGQVLGTRAMYVDITERKKAENALLRMATQRQRLLEVSVEMLSALNMDEAVQRILSTLEELLDLDIGFLAWVDVEAKKFVPDHVFGNPQFVERLKGADFPLFKGGIMNITLSTGQAQLVNNAHADPRVVFPNGRPQRPAHAIIVPVQVSGKTVGILSIARVLSGPFEQDEFELVQVFMAMAGIVIHNAQLYSAVEAQVREIQSQKDELRAVSAHMQSLQESERRWLASELHDQVGRNLTALGIDFQVLSTLIAQGQNDLLQPRLDEAMQLLADTTGLVRDLMTELRPPVLDDFGLFHAVKNHARAIQRRTGLQISVEASHPELRLSPERETALFRIAQEAINNVIKHARASRIEVRLETAGSRVMLTILDNGRGFDISQVNRQGELHHWGLLTMRERAYSAGGVVEIESSPGSGTVVRAWVELEETLPG